MKKEKLIKTFFDLVQIDSESGQEKKIGEHLMVVLRGLGGRLRRDQAGNLHAYFAGKGDAIMLNAHMDTVRPGNGVKPVVNGDRISSDGTTILGADNKVAIAAILEAIRSVREAKQAHVPIDVVFTVGEELLLKGVKAFDVKKLHATKGLTFDAGTTINEVCLSAPFYNSIDIQIQGKGAHAGFEPEKGISAIRIASEIISLLHVGRIDSETTANVGIILGGSVRNAVPASAHFSGEIRAKNEKKLEGLTRQWKGAVHQVAKKYRGSRVKLTVIREFNGYRFTEAYPLVSVVREAHRKLGFQTKYIEFGGGSDVNIFNTKGITTLGVGMGAWNIHTTREYTKISEMIRMVKFIEIIISVNNQ